MKPAVLCVAAAAFIAIHGCSRPPVDRYRIAVEQFGEIVTERRDTAEHPGPRWIDIDAALIESAATAANQPEYGRMTRLIDALDDERACIALLDAYARAYPEGSRYERLGGVDWISQSSPVSGADRSEQWARLVAIDGARPKARHADSVVEVAVLDLHEALRGVAVDARDALRAV